MSDRDRTTDPLDQISVRNLFMAMRWTNRQEVAKALKLNLEFDLQKIEDKFEGIGMAARGMNRFYAEELVAIVKAYLERRN